MMTVVWGGLGTGAIYSIIALGYNISLISSGILNFAQAQFVALGGFSGYWVISTLGLGWPVALLIGAVVGGLVAAAEHVLAIRPLRDRAGHTALVTTVGASTVISGLILVVWGPDALRVDIIPDTAWTVFGGRVQPVELLLIGFAVAAGLFLTVWTTRTRHGLAGLARTEDEEAASLRGINPEQLQLAGLVMAGAFGGLAGPIVADKTYAAVALGLVLGLKGFVALAVGGIGSFPGVLIGGFVVGLVEAFAARYVGSGYGDIAVVALLFIVVLARPAGILGRMEARLV